MIHNEQKTYNYIMIAIDCMGRDTIAIIGMKNKYFLKNFMGNILMKANSTTFKLIKFILKADKKRIPKPHTIHPIGPKTLPSPNAPYPNLIQYVGP